jgi:hypothetical protein
LVTTTILVGGFGASLPVWPICLALLCAGFGAGLSWVPATAASYTGLASEEISHGSPLVAVTMRLGASFGTAIAAIILQAQLNAGSAQTNHLQAAYRTSFYWEAGLAMIAALTYLYMCRVVGRTPVTTQTGPSELKLGTRQAV